ncbi:MAG: bifunctional riboflavin kinase/FAD synthetase [Firmicutes bacterium]|nr:bifunctional riboflavin kinase/FAD synthetase [Bacillota bacterium]
MKIFRNLDEINNMPESAVALGSFDGVHLGHQELIRRTSELAESLEIATAVFTFSNHPRDLIPGNVKTKNILYSEDKEKIMEELGVDYLIDIPFTEEIMHMSPENYVRELLIDKLNAKAICCGFNHRFGHRAEGTPELLKEIGEELGFTAYVMEPFYVDDTLVSSTLIRTLIAEGEVESCYEYLGRYYAISGDVVVGNRLGKSLGFPTSNLVMDDSMVAPPNGVYITYCTYNGVRYPSITNVGVKPTVGTFEKNIETHIFDFDGNIYGKRILVEFIRKMRDEVKFDSMEKLKKQIRKDCDAAKAYHEERCEGINYQK